MAVFIGGILDVEAKEGIVVRKWGLLVVGLLLILGFWVYREWPGSEVEVVVCDVGQGDGMVIIEGNRQVVIDVGRDDGRFLACLSRVMPFWDRTIEGVMLTHADADHAGGLTGLMDHYEVSQVLSTETTLTELEDILRGVEVEKLAAGDVWRYGSMVGEVVWPDENEHCSSGERNECSLVMRLEIMGGNSWWMAADAGQEIEKELLVRGKVRQTDILKVAHHGSKTATTESFLEILQPTMAVISVGENSYGHPDNGVLERLMKWGVEMKRTDEEGNLVF